MLLAAETYMNLPQMMFLLCSLAERRRKHGAIAYRACKISGGKCQTVCKPGSVPPHGGPRGGDGHSSGTLVAERLARPTRAAARQARPAASASRRRLPLLLGLAPGWVYPAAAVAGGAVRSYRTISPLPPIHPIGRRARRCVSVALSLGSPPPGVTRHRASVEPGLSSLRE